MKERIKNFNNKITKKTKIITYIILGVILVLSAILFTNNTIMISKLKDADNATEILLDTFYSKKYDKRIAKVLLNKDSQEYFNELENDLYSKVYNSLKNLGDQSLIEGKDAVSIAKEYSSSSLTLLKRVQKYSIIENTEIEDGYSYTVKILPENLSYIYDLKNTCISKKIKEYKNEKLNEAISYYCSIDAINAGTTVKGAEVIVNIEMIKNDKGYYVPTEKSLNTLLAAVL